MKDRTPIILAVIVIVLAIIFIVMYKTRESSPIVVEPFTVEETAVTPVEDEIINDVIFVCTGDKTIGAQFRSSSVDLQLNDGRTMTLPQAISASGARYANADESFVFWNKGDTAFVTEGSETTF
ncbi:MAG: MliC family protein, partial [Candidatus Parcubacteria bacterium]|nr:MliC family protein [Candidatus Parcubacteria bacterium]